MRPLEQQDVRKSIRTTRKDITARHYNAEPSRVAVTVNSPRQHDQKRRQQQQIHRNQRLFSPQPSISIPQNKKHKKCAFNPRVTLEPCAMCAGAIAHVRLRRLYFAAYDQKGGAVDHGPCLFNQLTTHHKIEIFLKRNVV